MSENKYVNLAKVKRVRPTFLYEPFIPENVISLFAGRAGVGKSTMMMDCIAKVSNGRLEGDYKGEPLTTMVYSQEDSDSMLKSRLLAAGADMSRIIPFYKEEKILLPDGSEMSTRSPYTLPADIGSLEAALTENSAKVLVLDPITSVIAGDSNKRDDVRKSLDCLAALAERLNVAVIGLLHFNKGGGYASDKLSGSHAFRDVCRSLILVAKDDETGERIVTVDKSNYTQSEGMSYAFDLGNKDIPDDNGDIEHIGCVLNWRLTDKSVNSVINKNTDTSRKSQPNNCERDLIKYLEEHGGKAPKQQVIQDLRPDYSSSQLEHAQQRITRIESQRSGYQGKSTWVLTPVDNMDKLDNIRNSNDSTLFETGENEPIYPLLDNMEEPRNSNDSRVLNSNLSILTTTQYAPESDIDEFLNRLPQYACDVNFKDYSSEELVAIQDHKPGLWHTKAVEELERRKS